MPIEHFSSIPAPRNRVGATVLFTFNSMKFIRHMKKGDTIMKTDLYYFSGTGNSLTIAQNLSKKMEHSTIISIPHVMNKANNITGEIIGIVCPIYFHNMPHIVRDFIKKISVHDKK